MAITKNRQSVETISVMAKKAFPDKQIAGIKELTEGMCNVTYDIAFEDGSKCILKIAAKDRSGNTSNEVNLMLAETRAMKLVKENCSWEKIIGLAPRVLYPAHGKPFKTSDLKKYLPFLDGLRLYPL